MKKLTATNIISPRSAFSLVELLLVISIIAVLASLGVGLMAQAREDAAVAATRSRISMIQKILETELEDYEVKRSPVRLGRLVQMVGSASYSDTSQGLLHVKNLKRIILADLIRAEMPDGAAGLAGELGVFPSKTLVAYLDALDIPLTPPSPTSFPTVPGYPTSPWGFWDGNPAPTTPRVEYSAVERSEMLYQVLLDIDVDGIPAVEQIGPRAIRDTDNNDRPEVVDAWGEPIFLQWQQEELVPEEFDPTSDTITEYTAGLLTDTWKSVPLSPTLPSSPSSFVGLTKEDSDLSFGDLEYAKPVLPTQIRPFLFSARLNEIDGIPVDYNANHNFDPTAQ